MPDANCTIRVDGLEIPATTGESLAVALLNNGHIRFRQSCSGQGRDPLCGMGICYECRVRISGRWTRACLEPVRDGMEISTHE